MVLLFGRTNRKYRGETPMDQIHEDCKSEDGFLYCQFLTLKTLNRLQSEQRIRSRDHKQEEAKTAKRGQGN